MKDQFIQFLRDHKVLIKYRAGLVEQKKGTIDQFLNINKPGDYMYCAFAFHETEQGHEFWWKLSEQWDELLNKKL